MDAQLKKGLLEMCVLAVIRNGETYGYRIISELEPFIGITETTLYPILRRLESGGLVSVDCREYNGRVRRYFRITESGKARLKSYKEQLREVQRIMDFIMREGGQFE